MDGLGFMVVLVSFRTLGVLAAHVLANRDLLRLEPGVVRESRRFAMVSTSRGAWAHWNSRIRRVEVCRCERDGRSAN